MTPIFLQWSSSYDKRKKKRKKFMHETCDAMQSNACHNIPNNWYKNFISALKNNCIPPETALIVGVKLVPERSHPQNRPKSIDSPWRRWCTSVTGAHLISQDVIDQNPPPFPFFANRQIDCARAFFGHLGWLHWWHGGTRAETFARMFGWTLEEAASDFFLLKGNIASGGERAINAYFNVN